MDNNPQDSVLNACDATATVHENANASVEGLTSNLTNNNYIYRDDVVKLNDGNKVGMVTEVAGELDSESDITDDDDDDDDDAEEEEEDDDDEEEEGEREVEGDREEGKEEAGEEEGEKERGDAEDEGGENIRNSDANESADEKRNNDSLLPDQVRVLWLDDSESSHNINELALVDRGFLHGDYVASASNPTGQVGLVVDVNIYVDLLTPDGSIIKDVCTRDLKRVRDITLGDFVIFGPWLGRVDDVLDNVTVLFDDGSVCKVIRADPLRLIPTNRSSIEDGHCPYHPGQRVRASSSSIFKNSLWSSGSWKANKREGTVMKISVGSVYCHWIASAGYGPESSSTPAEEQSPKNLKLLSCFTHANWQLGDWCLLPSSALSSSIPLDKGLSKLELQEDSGPAHAGSVSDEATPEESTGTSEPMDLDRLISNDGTGHCNVSSKSGSSVSSLSVSKGSAHETWPIHRKKLRKVVIKREKKIRKKEETFEKALQIVNTKTRVSVAWQDGVIENQLETTSLIPVESPGDHDFVAEQYVVERGNDDTEDVSEIRRVGVVKSVNSKEKTSCVKWLKPVARPEDLREFDKEEIVSVYELEGHPDYDYCYGDVVVRLSPISLPDEANYLESGEEMQQQSGSNVLKHETKKQPSVSEADNPATEDVSTEFSDLSWVGNITGLKDGDIEVTWADGMVSTVGPQAIYVVGRDDDEASVAAGSEISDAASWETVEDDDEMDAHGSDQKEPVSANDTDINTGMEEIVVDGENNPGRNGPLSIPLAAIGFVTRLASGIFSRGRKDEDLLRTDAADEGEEFPLRDTSNPAEGPYYGSASQDCSSNGVQVIGDKDDEECTNLVNEKPNDPPIDAGSLPLDNPSTDNYSFKHFDTAKDPLDHFFLDVDTSRNSNRKWLKKVQQDWNILQNNLPDSIYVRVYEDRMDLLRAVIVGAYGTPYQDGMFFFDFHLPAEYPDVPPSAHYHSGGWRLNPNLYEEGKVCLSLLNTWTGKGNEVWDPKCSSILQVLVSLQGLVLNSKPYFNEAGYDKQVGTAEGEKNSLSYNENTFLLNCKTIMYLIRKPPKDFDVLVKDHFKHRGYYILKACDAYMKGYLIGTLTENASVNEKSEPNATSVGFKLMLAKLLPKLYTALSELGADCSEFKHLQQS